MAYPKVLAVLTGDETDQGVLAQGADMVRPVKGTLYAVYVITVDRGLPVDAEVGPEAARGEQILINAEASVELPRGDFEAQLLQARELGPAVVREAAERDVDAVVIGTSCPLEYGRFSLGEDVPYVLEHARCLVVLWREPPTRGQGRQNRSGSRSTGVRQSAGILLGV
jgi:nucleotide-binding universal stress UspA family protein